MAKNEQYKKRLATANLAEAQAMDKAYADAHYKGLKEYTYNGLKYAVTGAPRTYAADIVKARITKTPTATTPTPTTTRTTTTPTTPVKTTTPTKTTATTTPTKTNKGGKFTNNSPTYDAYNFPEVRLNDGSYAKRLPDGSTIYKNGRAVWDDKGQLNAFSRKVERAREDNEYYGVGQGGEKPYVAKLPKEVYNQIKTISTVKPRDNSKAEKDRYFNELAQERAEERDLFASYKADAPVQNTANKSGYPQREDEDYGAFEQRLADEGKILTNRQAQIIQNRKYVAAPKKVAPPKAPPIKENMSYAVPGYSYKPAPPTPFTTTKSPANFNYQGIEESRPDLPSFIERPVRRVVDNVFDNRPVTDSVGYELGQGLKKTFGFANGGNLPKMWAGGPFDPTLDYDAQAEAMMAAAGNTGQTATGATGAGRGLDLGMRVGNAGKAIEYGARTVGGGISNVGKSIAVGAGDVNRRLKDPNDTTGTMGMATMGLQAGSQAINMIDGMDGKPSKLGGIASGAMSGASMGAVGGLPGMAAGAVIGGGLALLQAEQAKKEQARADKRYMSNLTDQNNFTSQQTLRNYASHGITSAGSYAYGGGISRPNTNPVSESTLIVKPKIKTGNADYKKLAEQQDKADRRTKAAVETGLNAASYLRMIPTPPTQAIGWGAAGASSLLDLNDARVALNKGDGDTMMSEGFGAVTNLLPIKNAKYVIPNRNGLFKIIANNMGNINNGINTYNDYNDLKKAGEESLYAYGGELSEYGKGGKIHIKPENRGKFTAYKKRTGKTTEEALHSKDPHVRKMANFAKNAKKWKHGDGGTLKPYRAKNEEDYKFRQGAYTDSLNAYNTGREVASTIGKNYSTYFKSPEYAKAYLDSYTSGGKKLHPYAEATKYSPKDKVSRYGEEMRAFNATQPKGKETALNAASATALDKLKANKVNPTKILRFTESPSVPIYKKPVQPILPPSVPLETLPIKDYEEYIPQKMPWSTDYDKQTYPDGGILDKAGRLINEGATKATRAVLPINAAMYAQDLTGNMLKKYTGDNFLTRGTPIPLTEKDLTPEELAVMRSTHNRAAYEREKYLSKYPTDTNVPKELSYDAYPETTKYNSPDPGDIGGLAHAVMNPSNRMMTTVGGAMYHKNKKGEDVITDKFDFAGKNEQSLAASDAYKASLSNPYGYLHGLIATQGSNKEGSGIPVNINLGKPKPKAKPVRSGTSYFAPKPFNGKKNYAFGGMQEPEYEVEGGEMIQGQPMLEDGQQEQVASDMVKVPDYAPSHADGGVDGAGGDRVFSDRLKTTNKKTYAEEAEQLAKQKAKFEAKIPSTNEAIRNTGERMSERMDMKLDELFNEQEMKKMYAMPSSISSSMAMAYGGHLPKLLYGENLKKPFNYPIGYQYGKAPGSSIAPLPRAGGWKTDPRSLRPTNAVNRSGQYNAQTRGRAFAPGSGMYLAPGRTSPEGYTNTYLEPTTVDRQTGTQFYVGGDYQDPNALQKLAPRESQLLPTTGASQFKMATPTPIPTTGAGTGGATAKAMKNGNGIPWQYVDNLASGIMTANTPELAKPYLDPRVDLNTNYDINPQLSSARNTRDALNKSIAASTPQGGASAANRQQLFASYNENANSLYAQKNNIENELKNKEILLNSGINSKNNDKRYAYDEQNVLRRAGIQQDIVGNAQNFALDQYTSARDAKTDARDLENTKQIAMANANAFQYGSQAGLKAIEDIYMANPAQLDSDIATIEKASPNNPALVNMRALQAKLKNR